MPSVVNILGRRIGLGNPVLVVAEIGINHNGDLQIAKQLVDAALSAGCDVVKFQKRTPSKCVPVAQQPVLRKTPWGLVSYLEYRNRMEFGLPEFREIDEYCRTKGIPWFASCFDCEAVDFVESFAPPCYKVPSACLTDHTLLRHIRRLDRPIILSTGMSTIEEIKTAVGVLGSTQLLIAHCTSSYPSAVSELNLLMIPRLRDMFSCPIGYSGHEIGLDTTLAAVALGACFVERHITLNHAMWGTDHKASLEPRQFRRLVQGIRLIEQALGDGEKRVYESEIPNKQKMRRCE